MTRPGRFGNPCDTAAEFRKSLAELVDQRSAFNLTLKTEQLNRMVWIHEHLHELKDTDLACWCPLDAECHADVLIEFANP